MDQPFTMLGIGSLAFAATNVDDLLLLVALFADPRFKPGQVVAGQFLGMLLLIAASLVLSALSLAVSPRYLGLFGLAPLVIGLRQLYLASSGRGSPAAALIISRINILGVATLTVADGGDNIGTYAPLFTSMAAPELRLVIGLFLALTALWCAAAYGLVCHPALGRPIRRHGPWLLPWVLIGLGVYILVRTHALGIF